MTKHRFVLALLLGGLTTTAISAEDKLYYRYTNTKGVVVIVGKLPPEAAPLGYDVITRSGQVIERVPRQLTNQELLEKKGELARQQLRKKEVLRLAEWDKSLMLRYSSIADIEAARKRAKQSVKVRISILKSNRSAVKSEIERDQSQAADVERRNGEVPKALEDKIELLHLKIQDIGDSISAREDELTAIDRRLDLDISRFATLQDHIKMRNQSSAKPSNKHGY